jgi:cyclin L
MAHLSNPLATAEQLYRRSSFSALPTDLQDAIYFATQCLTQAAGLLLELPQSTTIQANVIIGRYWLVDSPMAHEFSVCIVRSHASRVYLH